MICIVGPIYVLLYDSVSCLHPPPRSPDHIRNPTVVIVLVLQTSPHNLVRVRHCHCKYFGDGCYGDVL